MAHFAQLDENNVVIRVMRISDDDMTDEDGNEVEAKGVALCQTLCGADTTWVQTSLRTRAGTHPDGKPLRHHFAAIDDVYDPDTDTFLGPQPFPSWTLVEIPDPSDALRADRAPDQKADPRGTLLGRVTTTRRDNTEEAVPLGGTIKIWKAPVDRPEPTLNADGVPLPQNWDEAAQAWVNEALNQPGDGEGGGVEG